MKHILFILFSFCLFNCKPTNEIYVNNFSSMPLLFSSDTILFDTLITSDKISITKRLIVYNPTANAININSISLGNSINSPFTMFLNGVKSTSFTNVELLGSDSLYVLVNVTVAPSNKDNLFILSDSINFNVGNYKSSVVLNTWGQDAFFHVDDTIKSNNTFLNNKPHVVYGNLVVDPLVDLTIIKGTNFYFYNNSSLIVNGNIYINGTKTDKVFFKALRQDDGYNKLPGQWNGILINSDGFCNVSWASILNAKTGLLFTKKSTSTIHNSFIGYVSESCISSSISSIFVYNNVFHASINSLIKITGGEAYLINNTLNNFSTGFGSNNESLFVSDIDNAIQLKLVNNIVWGNLSSEFYLKVSNLSSNVLSIKNNIFKKVAIAEYNDNIFITDLHKFKFENSSLLKFTPDTISVLPLVLSPAINKAEIYTTVTDLIDFQGNFRDSNPDIGAVEFFK